MLTRKHLNSIGFLAAALLLVLVAACAPAAPQSVEATDAPPVAPTSAPTQVVEVEETASPHRSAQYLHPGAHAGAYSGTHR